MRAAVLGSPISHSLSPALHNAAYLALGVEGKYDAVEVKTGELPDFMARVRNIDANWIGFSLTMPLKEEIFQVADRIDPLAMQINSGNTLIPSGDGWLAMTTDVSGFVWALAANGIHNFQKIMIIGSGATARAAAAAVDAPGREISVMARSKNRLSAMENAISFANLEYVDWGSRPLAADLIINTTPKGAADSLAVGEGTLFESLYDPWPTQLAKSWNGKVIDGLELLVHQAVDQIHLMTGFVVDRSLMAPLLRTAGEAELRDRR